MNLTKIVITGGPCAGKTTGLSWIQNAFTNKGYTVLFIPETATEFITGGVAPWTCGSNLDYQKVQMALQLKKEALFEEAARTMKSEKILLVCDRGALDNKAYMNREEFDEVLRYVGRTEVSLRDSYDAVFHMVSAAKGVPEIYSNENNQARYETVEQAADLDDRFIEAWTGHPHLRVIDNNTDFQEKLRRLIHEITSVLGESEIPEVKRKFLIDMPDLSMLESLPNCSRVEINQIYLHSNDDSEVRLRQRGFGGSYIYYETIKRTISDGKRITLERRLTENEYLRLIMEADTNYRAIRKTRYCLAYHNLYFSIDIYPFFSNQAIVEVEMPDEAAKVDFPDWIHVVREVTNEPEFEDKSLAKIKN